MKKYTTKTKTDHRTKAKLVGTEFHIAIPDSMMRPAVNGKHSFNIGCVRFLMQTNYAGKAQVQALDPIPASWFIDISEVIDESEEVAA